MYKETKKALTHFYLFLSYTEELELQNSVRLEQSYEKIYSKPGQRFPINRTIYAPLDGPMSLSVNTRNHITMGATQEFEGNENLVNYLNEFPSIDELYRQKLHDTKTGEYCYLSDTVIDKSCFTHTSLIVTQHILENLLLMAVFKKHLKEKVIVKHGIGVSIGQMATKRKKMRTRMTKAPTIKSAMALSIGATSLPTEYLII